MRALIAATAFLLACSGAAPPSPTEESPPQCAMIPDGTGTRADEFLQHGDEGDFWCSADGTAVQGITSLKPIDGGVLCTCPQGTACAPTQTGIGQPAVSCWMAATQ